MALACPAHPVAPNNIENGYLVIFHFEFLWPDLINPGIIQTMPAIVVGAIDLNKVCRTAGATNATKTPTMNNAKRTMKIIHQI